MKSNRNFILILLFAGAMLGIKFLFFPSGTVAPVQPQQAQATNVYAIVVHPEKFENKIFSTGTINANEEVDLKAEASGKITQLLFKEGDQVSKGDMLLKLNDADLLAQKKKLELQIKLASEKESRSKKLLDIKGISQEEYDAALNQLESLQADLDFTKAQILKTEIRSPFNGTIGLKSVSEGSYVSPSVKIASIQQLDPVKIDFSIPEKYASLVHKGTPIFFTISGTDEKFNGSIYAIEPKIDLATRTLQLRALCQNKSGKILPGAFAKIELVLKQMENTILIPTQSLIPELKGQKVFLYKQGKAQPQKVETGLRTDTKIEITSGLQDGDTLLTEGFMQLRPGSPVKIKESK